MTATTTNDIRTTVLSDVDDALVRAHELLMAAPLTEAVHDALLQLAASSFDAVVAWEHDHEAVDDVLDAPSAAGSWRARVEELRLQSALATMEAREVVGAAGERASALAARLQNGVEELARLTASATRGDADIVLL